MTTSGEIGANALNAVSIFLAGRNSVHTWWTGILGCVLFGWVFFGARLYADVTLQVFFVATSVIGWWSWERGGERGAELAVRHTGPAVLGAWIAAGGLVAAGYGALLHELTDAYAPFLDSVVLAFSVVGQLLLTRRQYESWYFWLLVNTVAVPLYVSRGLHLTAALYVAFWVNAAVSLVRWRRLVAA